MSKTKATSQIVAVLSVIASIYFITQKSWGLLVFSLIIALATIYSGWKQ